METIDIVTLVIAFWGALLSTIIAVREFLKEKRKLHCYIDFVDRFDAPYFRVVNNGHRPITIISMELWLYRRDGKNFSMSVR